jgi:isopenicillin N synthase-like dioxygenase
MMLCRDAIFEYAKHVKNLGDRLFELLSEALGLKPSYLTDIECNFAIGKNRHSDAGFLTILLQDGIGGLQILPP